MYNFKQKGIVFGDSRGTRRPSLREFIRPKIARLKELIIFIRPETCLFISGIAVSGYLIFNGLDIRVIFLISTVFLASATGYAYNYITDKKEDLINNKQLNFFVLNKTGILVITLLLLSGVLSSLMISTVTTIFYLLWTSSGLMYSALRVKEIFLLKNFYTGAQMAMAFVIGALVNHPLTLGVIAYLPFFFPFGFILNLLGDIRGYDGDRVCGVKTIPVLFGKKTAKTIINITIGLFFFGVLLTRQHSLYLTLPFMIGASYFLGKNDLRKTRFCILSPQILLPIFILLV